MSRTILIIAGSTTDRKTYKQSLHRYARQSCQFVEFDNGGEALSWCQENTADIILLDYQLMKMGSLEFLKQFWQQYPDEMLSVILLGNTVVAVEARKLGVQHYLDKDQITKENLLQRVQSVFRQAQLQRKLSRQQAQNQIVNEIALRMRESLDAQHVLDRATQDIGQFLQVDRVLVYQFAPDWSGLVVSEFVESGYPKMLGQRIQDTCFQQGAGVFYMQGHTWAMPDIEQANLANCHQELLQRFAVKANLVVPILQNVSTQADQTFMPSLWGLLIAHHCSKPYDWKEEDITFVEEIAVHLSGAIQQAALYQKVQAELAARKQAEIALAESEARLKLAQIFSKSGVWDWDLLTNTVFWSPEYYALYNLDARIEPSYDNWLSCIHPDDREQINQKTLQALEDGSSEVRVEFRVVSFDELRWFNSIGQVLRNASGEPIRIMGTVTDVTALKQMQRKLHQCDGQLQATRQEVEQASHVKNSFLRMMNHEFRTPLNPILGMAEVLQGEAYGTLNDRQKQSVSMIYKNGQHLLTLVDNILDLVRLETSRITLNCYPVLVKDLCQASLNIVLPQAVAKAIHLKSYISPEVRKIKADGERMNQVLIHLLENAIKFTPEGGVVMLEVQMSSTCFPSNASATPCVQFSIKDTGIGIAPEQFKHLFQFFTQLDDRLNRNYEGTGIGLALVQRLVELHGGQIAVESQLGQGSCFKVSLPCTI